MRRSKKHPKGISWLLFFEEMAVVIFVFGLSIIAGLTVLGSREVFIVSQPITLGSFLLTFMVGTVVMMGLMRWGKWSLMRGLIFFALFFGAFLFFHYFLPLWFALLASLFVVVARARFPSFLTHNALLIFSVSGMGVFLGLTLDPWMAVTILLLLAMYDYVAVFWTRHMVYMARVSLRISLPPAFLFPDDSTQWFAHPEQYSQKHRLLFVGGGDVLLPLLVTLAVLPYGFSRVLCVALGTLAGFVFLHFIARARGVAGPLPALPSIASGTFFGFFMSVFI